MFFCSEYASRSERNCWIRLESILYFPFFLTPWCNLSGLRNIYLPNISVGELTTIIIYTFSFELEMLNINPICQLPHHSDLSPSLRETLHPTINAWINLITFANYPMYAEERADCISKMNMCNLELHIYERLKYTKNEVGQSGNMFRLTHSPNG